MTSAINPNTIDVDFPVAGVDNDSQGFRDNFTAIKTGLDTAKSEITTLQTYSAKLGNDAGTEVVNDFGGNIISNAKTSRVYANAYQTYATSNTNISWNDGEYQAIEMRGNFKLTFIDWPEADGYGKMRIELKSNGTARTVTFAAGSGYSLKKEIGTALVTVPSTGGAVRNAQLGLVGSTQFSFPTASFTTITGAGFQVGNMLTGSGLTNDVVISVVDNISTTATTTVATLTIPYNDIVTGTDTVVSMGAAITSITDGDPITLPNVTGVGALSALQVYYVYKDGGGNIKLSTTQSPYTAIVSSGTYTGGPQSATFRQSANSNRVTVGDSTKMYVNMPIRFTGTGFGGVSEATDYYVHSVIDSTGIRLSTTAGGVPIALTGASGTLTIVPRTVLTTTFNSQTVTAGTALTLTTNVQGVPTPFTVDADPTKIKIIEVWKQPYEDIVFLKYLGEFA
jgi:hypothetical protein